MVISNNMKIKMDFNSTVYQQISQQLALLIPLKAVGKRLKASKANT
jgi:hypothetical protein